MPEFGRSPDARISIVTRSGENRFHGVDYDYFRNDAALRKTPSGLYFQRLHQYAGCHNFLNPHSYHSPTELFAVYLIPISE
jgi:hypothetical protein